MCALAELNTIRLPDVEKNQVTLVANANHAEVLIRKMIASQFE